VQRLLVACCDKRVAIGVFLLVSYVPWAGVHSAYYQAVLKPVYGVASKKSASILRFTIVPACGLMIPVCITEKPVTCFYNGMGA
jgi:hypothetical protein